MRGFREDRRATEGCEGRSDQVSRSVVMPTCPKPRRSLAAPAVRVVWRSEQGRHEYSPVVQASDLAQR